MSCPKCGAPTTQVRIYGLSGSKHSYDDSRNRELTRQVEQMAAEAAVLQARVDAAEKAMSGAESFIAVMFGRGPDCVVPETIYTPLGIPVQVRRIVLALQLAQSLTATPAQPAAGEERTTK